MSVAGETNVTLASIAEGWNAYQTQLSEANAQPSASGTARSPTSALD